MAIMPEGLPSDIAFEEGIGELPSPTPTPEASKPVQYSPIASDLSGFPKQDGTYGSAHPALADYVNYLIEETYGGLKDSYVIFGCTVTKNNNNQVSIEKGAVLVANTGLFPVLAQTYNIIGFESFTGLLLIGIDTAGIVVLDEVITVGRCYIAVIQKNSGTITQIRHSIQYKLTSLNLKKEPNHSFVLGKDFLSTNGTLGYKKRQRTGPFILGESILSTGCWLGNGEVLGDLLDE